MRVRDGRYTIENKAAGKTWCTWRRVSIDPLRDFEIEARVVPYDRRGLLRVDGQLPAIGLLWGGKDVDNYHVLMLRSDSQLTVQRRVDAQWNSVIPWQPCRHVDPGHESNVFCGPSIALGVAKKAHVLEFRVNGAWIEDADFEPFLGDNVGFYVCDEVSLGVESLKVIQR